MAFAYVPEPDEDEIGRHGLGVEAPDETVIECVTELVRRTSGGGRRLGYWEVTGPPVVARHFSAGLNQKIAVKQSRHERTMPNAGMSGGYHAN